jgi:hypothetical protein
MTRSGAMWPNRPAAAELAARDLLEPDLERLESSAPRVTWAANCDAPAAPRTGRTVG